MLWTLVVAAAIGTAACGDSKTSLLPTAPSAVSADAATADGGSAEGEYRTTANGPKPGNGNGNGNGNDNRNRNGNGNGNQPRTPTNTSPDPTPPVTPGKNKVEFEGFIQAVSSSSILVNGQVIMVTTETVIRHGNRRFDLADLNAGDRVHVRASRVSTPTTTAGAVVTATLEATQIMLQNPGDEDEGGETDALISVAALDATATETPLTTGTFRLTRTGSAAQLALPHTVSFTLGGTATHGVDYALPLTTTFLGGQTFVDVVVTPVVDTLAEGSETVVLTLTGVAPYELGSPITASVTITDTATTIVTGIR